MKKGALVVGLILAVAGLWAGGRVLRPVAQEPRQHVVVLAFDWDAGSRAVSVGEPITIARNSIVLEMRDRDGAVVTSQRRSVPDCGVVYDAADLPTGVCGSVVTFTVTLPHSGYWEEWVRGFYVGENGVVHTYTVPVRPSLDTDGRGFTLVGTTAWYGSCPASLPTYTPMPTYTPRPTYTPMPTPTCEPTRARAIPTIYPTATLYPTSTPYPEQP